MKLILSIDGGGIRGLIPARILAIIEKHLGPLASAFDLIAGTSTGGIIACGIGAGVSAAEMGNIYSDRGGEIFHRSKLRIPAFQPKYSADGLEHVLEDVFKDQKFRSAKTRLLVPAYDMLKDGPTHFKSWEPDPAPTFVQVARATSAAPTYFPSADGQYIDGGIFANNPTLNAMAEAENLWPTEQLFVLSLGTGFKPGHRHPIASGGLIQWASEIFSLALDAPPHDVEYMAQAFLGDHYSRITGELPAAIDGAMDNASPTNIIALEKFADYLLAKCSRDLERFLSAARTELSRRGLKIQR